MLLILSLLHPPIICYSLLMCCSPPVTVSRPRPGDFVASGGWKFHRVHRCRDLRSLLRAAEFRARNPNSSWSVFETLGRLSLQIPSTSFRKGLPALGFHHSSSSSRHKCSRDLCIFMLQILRYGTHLRSTPQGCLRCGSKHLHNLSWEWALR